MIPREMKMLAMALIVLSVIGMAGCAGTRTEMAGNLPAANDPWGDLAGGFPQH